MDNPFFTVVIPTHNRSALLYRAIVSVLNQTFKSFEIIVVDDHSTDDTQAMVKSFIDQRLNYLQNRRTKGACGARNTGIFAAKGKWIAFLDDDDIWYTDKLKYQFNLIQDTNTSVGLICTDYEVYKGEKGKKKVIKNRLSGWVKNEILYGGLIGCLSSTCVRSDIIIKINGFDEMFPSGQDQDLWIRVAEVSAFDFVPVPLVRMYQENRNRIGLNPNKKFVGSIMLRDKFLKNHSNLRLKCIFETNIFIYSLISKRKEFVKKSCLWFLLGTIVDFPRSIYCLKEAILLFFRFRKNILYLPWT